MLTDTEINC